MYEALKNALHSRPVPSQMLLLPEIIDLPEEDAERLAMAAAFCGTGTCCGINDSKDTPAALAGALSLAVTEGGTAPRCVSASGAVLLATVVANTASSRVSSWA